MGRLREQAEPLAALSVSHLSEGTRHKLLRDELSVNAYPTDNGGFVYVGAPQYDIPTEADLAAIFELAERAGVVWGAWIRHSMPATAWSNTTPTDHRPSWPAESPIATAGWQRFDAGRRAAWPTPCLLWRSTCTMKTSGPAVRCRTTKSTGPQCRRSAAPS